MSRAVGKVHLIKINRSPLTGSINRKRVEKILEVFVGRNDSAVETEGTYLCFWRRLEATVWPLPEHKWVIQVSKY